MTATVHLGYAVGSGEPVSIPVTHLAITGMTQQSGKTTTLEALISRSKLTAVTFVTKRGEGSFAGGHRLPPFFRERADWVFVSSLIDATLGEKNKLLRAWLMKVCRNTKTLAEVQRNVIAAKATARGFSESIYTEIEGYLELVVPQLARLPASTVFALREGINVIDLSPYSTELQALVIRSVIEYVAERESSVITVIPEAWEFLPEGRGSPVKREAETLIRKGAVLGNYVWLDSQDLAGVWKLAIRAAAVYLIGVQREANEIKRTLANIPAGISKPKAGDIATLERGEFFACWGRHVVKTYVQPAWMADETAQLVARGDRALAVQRASPLEVFEFSSAVRGVVDDQWKELERRVTGRKKVQEVQTEEIDDMTPEQEQKLDRVIELFEKGLDVRMSQPEKGRAQLDVSMPATVPGIDFEELYEAIKKRLMLEAPQILKVLAVKPELRIVESAPTIELDGKTLRGRLARMIADGFFDDAKAGNAAFNELKRVGFKTAKPNVYRECDALAELGFLTKESDGFHAVEGMKRSIKRSAA